MRCEACGAVWCYVCRKVIDDSATHFEWDLYGDFGEGGAGVRFYGPGAVDIGNDIEVVADPDPDAGPADSCGSGDDETRRSPPSSAIESTDSAPRKRKCLLWDREPLEVIHAREANEALDRALAAATATSAFAPSAPGRELDGQSKIWIDGGGAELVELKEKLRLPLVFDTGTSSTSQLGGNGVGVRRRSLGMGRGRNFGRYDYHCGTRRVSEIEMRAGNIVQAATDRSEQGGGGDFGGLGQLVSWVGMGRSGVGKELKADGFTWSAWADRGALYSATEEAMDHLDEAEVVRMLVSQTDFEGGRGM
ncbi:hypothetical protein FA15DRAFT_163545 [Coprinopsis marcescibilis]|uniref:Uncharacterized protein n=1 Tax=Coprinopsis marcescibilis TaxID=230819 RepID=A0A5C3KHS4_COPMA|nr:hypothetical protein FA15DRAFT_163545 [Coprinopsis marcescibilis]